MLAAILFDLTLQRLQSHLVLLVDWRHGEQQDVGWRHKDKDKVRSTRFSEFKPESETPVAMVLTEDEDGDAIEDGSYVGQQPHDHGQLRRKHQHQNTVITSSPTLQLNIQRPQDDRSLGAWLQLS